MDSFTEASLGELMIKSAAQILVEIYGDPGEVERQELQRLEDLKRPLKAPQYPGQQRRNRYPDKRKPREIKVRLCSVSGCTTKHRANGYCDPHNYRFKTYGSPYGGRVPVTMLGKMEGLGRDGGQG